MLVKLIQKHSKSLNNLLKYLVAAILLTVPLFPKFPFVTIPNTFVSIRIEDFLIATVAFIWFISILPSIKEFFKPGINKAILIFLGLGLLSLLSAIFVTKTVIPHIGLLHWLRRIEYFIPFFVGLSLIKANRKNLEFFLKVMMITIVIAFIYGFGQRHFSWPIIVTQNEEYSRGVALNWAPGSHISSTFAGHYDLATYLILLLPIYIAIFFNSKLKTNNIKTKLALLVVIFSGLWLISYSGSRISSFSFLVASTTALILIKKYKAIPLMIVVSIIFFSFSANLQARYLRLIQVVEDRVVEIISENKTKGHQVYSYNFKPSTVLAAESSGLPQRKTIILTPTPAPVFEDRSTNIRINVEWPRAIRALKKNPLLGTGYSSITLATDNDYLRLLGEVGILGFFSFFLIVFVIAKAIIGKFPLIKSYKGLELPFVAGFLGAVPGIFINALFIDVFEASKFATVFWLVTGLFFAVVSFKNNE